MRSFRTLLTAAALLLATACADASASTGGVWVRVSPTTVTAGHHTQIQANCGANVTSATATSTAFGNATLHTMVGVLTAEVTVPQNTPDGSFDVRLTCPGGAQAITTLTVASTSSGGKAPPAVPGPGTGGGFLAGGGSAPADRTPLVWLGLGLASLLAAAAVALQAKGLLPAVRTLRPLRAKPTGPTEGGTDHVTAND